MTSRLTLYNGALMICGERKLASLTENREPRRLLDDVWTRGAVRFCLEQGQWKFAQRTSKLIYDPSITPSFGYQRGFEKPTDWVRTTKLCSDESFTMPLLRYQEEAGFIFADMDNIYVSYVSDDTTYGSDLSLWPETFREYVECYLASRIVRRLTQSGPTEDMVRTDLKRLLIDARSKDALQGPTAMVPNGTWSESRRGRVRRDNGSRTQLIG